MKASNFRQSVTDTILDALKAGTKPWKPSWDHAGFTGRPLRSNGQAYRGINTLVLWISAEVNGFTSPYWLTFNQAKDLGASVRKGSKSTKVVVYKPVQATDEDEDTTAGRPAFARCYSVFNADQIEGLDSSFEPTIVKAADRGRSAVPHAAYDQLMRHHRPVHEEVFGRAYYDIPADKLAWPPCADFESPDAHLVTALHELGHWSGAASRLDREGITAPRNRERYAFEELCVELAAAFMGASLGLRADHLDDHASYIDHWISALENDPGLISRAAAEAERIADFVLPPAVLTALVHNHDNHAVPLAA